ncbi:MAG: bifunctional riboflavin kinase/FAD synthetase [Candidatus Cloacimonadia bacterium]
MISSQSEFSTYKYPVITMGTFDGVHLGHQALLKKVKERAVLNGGEAIAITYYQHPKGILSNINTPYLLTERERKTSILNSMGIDNVVYLSFNEEMSKRSADFFLQEVLINRLGAKEIVFGYDCHFGHNRGGNCQFLKENETKYGYSSFIVEPVVINDQIVSSSLIRKLIIEGNVEEAKAYLGRSYDLYGKVVHGLRIGREIGFPTMNIKPADEAKLLPSNGVYFGSAIIDGKRYHCLTNIGYAPTVKDTNERSVESFLLDFQGEVYGQTVTIDFIKRIRDEVKFPNRETLIAAIKSDVQIALNLINSQNHTG